jgi:hypothetical protein
MASGAGRDLFASSGWKIDVPRPSLASTELVSALTLSWRSGRRATALSIYASSWAASFRRRRDRLPNVSGHAVKPLTCVSTTSQPTGHLHFHEQSAPRGDRPVFIHRYPASDNRPSEVKRAAPGSKNGAHSSPTTVGVGAGFPHCPSRQWGQPPRVSVSSSPGDCAMARPRGTHEERRRSAVICMAERCSRGRTVSETGTLPGRRWHT